MMQQSIAEVNQCLHPKAIFITRHTHLSLHTPSSNISMLSMQRNQISNAFTMFAIDNRKMSAQFLQEENRMQSSYKCEI